jgi:hypothetical protein
VSTVMQDLVERLHIIQITKYSSNEISGACSAYGGGKRRVQGFGGKT